METLKPQEMSNKQMVERAVGEEEVFVKTRHFQDDETIPEQVNLFKIDAEKVVDHFVEDGISGLVWLCEEEGKRYS